MDETSRKKNFLKSHSIIVWAFTVDFFMSTIDVTQNTRNKQWIGGIIMWILSYA